MGTNYFREMMATYTLKKTDSTDMGNPVYEITISFKDKNGKSQKSTQTVPLPKKGLKAAAQAYADEFQATVKKGT